MCEQKKVQTLIQGNWSQINYETLSPLPFQESQRCQQGPSLELTESVMEEPEKWVKMEECRP